MAHHPHTRTIAGLIGPLMAAIGLTMLVRRGAFAEMAAQFAADPALVFLTGALTLVAGAAIVRSHSVWSGWPAILTMLGWLAVVGGLARMLFAQEVAALAAPMLERLPALLAGGAVALALGAFLTVMSLRRAG